MAVIAPATFAQSEVYGTESGKRTSAYPVASARPHMLGIRNEPSPTGAGLLKQPDKQERTRKGTGKNLTCKGRVTGRMARLEMGHPGKKMFFIFLHAARQ